MFTGLLNQESLFVKKCTGNDLLIDQAKQSLSLNKSTLPLWLPTIIKTR